MRAKPSFYLVIILLLAVGLLIKFYCSRPQAWQAKLETATELVRAGDDRAAIPLLRDLVGREEDRDQTEPVAHLLARVLARQTDYSASEEIWKELAIFDDPGLREEVRFQLARVAAGRGEPDLLDEFLDRYPDSPRRGEALRVRGDLRQAAGDLTGVEEDYRAVLNSPGPEEPRAEARARLGEINFDRLFSGEDGSLTLSYTVRAGDSLSAIARKHTTTADLIQLLNRLPGDVIHPGQKLQIPAKSFSVRVSKSKNSLTLLYGGEFFKEYSVGTGRDNCSPEGEFTIVTKLIDPPWFYDGEVIDPSDERNILGTRWMGFQDPYATYGIHGTTQPETVGTQSSDGCVRMRNEEVEELFIFLPRGSRVVIEE